MSALDNPKHELFAQAIAKGASAVEAYEKAGYSPHRQAASRLLTNVDVAARVAELQNKAAAKTGITLESWIEEGAELMRKALLAGDSAAASQQYERVAKVAGFWVDRTDATQSFRTVSADPATPEQWQQQHAAEPLN